MPTCSRWRNNPTVNVDSLCQHVVQVGALAQQGQIQGAAHDVYKAETVLNYKLIRLSCPVIVAKVTTTE